MQKATTAAAIFANDKHVFRFDFRSIFFRLVPMKENMKKIVLPLEIKMLPLKNTENDDDGQKMQENK